MNRDDFRELLAAFPQALTALRPPASRADLADVEARLGIELPRDLAALLAIGNGGRFGDSRLYGTDEWLRLADEADRSGERALLPRFLPIHPVDRYAVEALDLSHPEAPIVWLSYPRGGPAPRSVRGLHPLAIDLLRGRAPELRAPTYDDLTDWLLDQVYDATLGPLALRV